MRLSPICLAATLLATAPAFAATPINELRPLAADGRLSIENPVGQVIVRTWDRPEVRITGSLGEGAEKHIVQGGPGELGIEIRNPGQQGWFGWGKGANEATRLEITLPRTASLEVEAVSADIDVAGTAGRGLSLSSVSGNVRVRQAKAGQAEFATVSGDLDAEIDTGALTADAVSGDQRIAGRVVGRVQLNSVSGDTTLVSGQVERLNLSTVSGNGHMTTALAASGRVEADTVSGDLHLVIPAETSARLQVETFSGGITSPVGTVHTEQYGPGKSLDARLGTGAGGIKLESFSGDVRITIE